MPNGRSLLLFCFIGFLFLVSVSPCSLLCSCAQVLKRAALGGASPSRARSGGGRWRSCPLRPAAAQAAPSPCASGSRWQQADGPKQRRWQGSAERAEQGQEGGAVPGNPAFPPASFCFVFLLWLLVFAGGWIRKAGGKQATQGSRPFHPGSSSKQLHEVQEHVFAASAHGQGADNTFVL